MNQPTHPPKRPFSVTILAMLVLIFTLLNALRWITAVRLRDFLAGLPLDVPVVYLILTGLFWMVVGIPLAVGLFFGLPWALNFTRVAVVLYTAYYWFDHLVIAQPGTMAIRWPFAAGLTLTLLIFAFWVLSRPKTRAYLRKRVHFDHSD